jgi:hypothetical protein
MQPDVLEKKVNIIVGRLLVMDGELLDTYWLDKDVLIDEILGLLQ